MASFKGTVPYMVTFLAVALLVQPIYTIPIQRQTADPSLYNEPGKCPTFPAADECPPEPDNECTSDYWCTKLYPDKGLKCCIDGCDFRCMPPLTTKVGSTVAPAQPTTDPSLYIAPGKCPTFPAAAECPPEPDNECTSDYWCTKLYPGKGFKCCIDGCDFRCMPPLTTKVGSTVAPAQPTTDPSLYIAPGKCPTFPAAAECPPEPDNECTSDYWCTKLYPGKGFKCCKDGCDFRCVPPLTIQVGSTVAPAQPTTDPSLYIAPGKCPTFPAADECPPEPDNECTSDYGCTKLYPGKGFKCCKDGCDFRCVPPLTIQVGSTVAPAQPTTDPSLYIAPGKCPTFPAADECPPEPDNECTSDYGCTKLYPGKGFKCCKDGCDFRCVPPLTIQVGSTVAPAQPTTDPSLYIAPGKCPTFPAADECPPEPDNECTSDYGCTKLYPGKGFKCCKDGCDFRCVPPLTIQVGSTVAPAQPTTDPSLYIAPGKCPTFPAAAECPPEPENECTSDYGCTKFYPGKEFKCCIDGCDFRCVPATTKFGNGKCPTFPAAVECPPEPYNECTSDYGCTKLYPGKEFKCCKDGCNFRCVSATIKVGSTVAPAQPTTDPSLYIEPGKCPTFPAADECPPEPDNECASDYGCIKLHPGLGLICCIDGCDFRCVPPVHTKVGSTVAPAQSTTDPSLYIEPGKCPTFPAADECPPEPDNECACDYGCTKLHPGMGLKCCIDGCDFRCLFPVPTKVGSTVAPAQSTTDPSLYIEPGKCPTFPAADECPPDPDNECASDYGCTKLHPGLGLICCIDGCDFRCVPPVPTKVGSTVAPAQSTTDPSLYIEPGKCPTFTAADECPPEPDNECASDYGCTKLHPGMGLKCCIDGCDFRCVPTTTKVRNGKCPTFPTADECPPDPDNECASDYGCTKLHPGLGLICCIDGCDFRCVPPVPTKVGSTVAPAQSTTDPSLYIEPGKCPTFPAADECPPEPDNECTSDYGCTKLHPGMGLKCCIDGCDFRCVPTTTKVRNGKCPTFPTAVECPPEPDNECTSDYGCTKLHPGKRFKCCIDGCDFRCMPPLTTKVGSTVAPAQSTTDPSLYIEPGKCPTFPAADECPPDPDNECASDYGCTKLHPGLGLICCIDGCDFRCVPPVPTKVGSTVAPAQSTTDPSLYIEPGKCPTFPAADECPPEPDNECTSDYGCTKLHPGMGLKCCIDGCDFRCVPTTTKVRNGKCPTFPTAVECPPEPDNECTSDYGCTKLHPGKGFKCCIDGCDFRCMPPLTTKVGSTVASAQPTTDPSLYIEPGKCPTFPTAAECPPEPDNECTSDYGCTKFYPGKGFKCCIDGCDFRCMPPLTTKGGSTVAPAQPTTDPSLYIEPGKCPTFPAAVECPPEPDNECTSDYGCNKLYPGKGFKCCIDGCDFRCMPPLTTKVGSTVAPAQPTTDPSLYIEPGK